MLVLLATNVFETTEILSLLGIFALCEATGHRIVVEPSARNRFDAWCSSFSQGSEISTLSDDLRAIPLSGREQINRPAELEVVVDGRRTSQWHGESPHLSVADALLLLREPLVVVLENGVNDRNFLLAFASKDVGEYLERAERAGRLVLTGPGGIEELVKQAESLADLPASSAYRRYFLCDSDALLPGEPQPSARAISLALRLRERELGFSEDWLGGHLQARAAENYAPPNEVERWAIENSDHPLDAQRYAADLHAGRENRGRHYPKVRAAVALRSIPWDLRSHIC
ncbi:MAG TPA: hypothetical protein PLA94_21130 [Myxococcota bacterium]|nr:hypothetical protein [Myxococcota bacterium]